MVITLGSTLRALRIWIDELPDAIYPVSTLTEFAIPAAPSPQAGARHAAVEYFRYTSPHTLNGLLGATFTPQRTGHLRVQIAVGSSGTRLDQTLNPFYALHTGIHPVMASDYIMPGIRETAHLSALGAGMIRFDHATEGPSIVIKWLVEAVIAVLATGKSDTLNAHQLQEVMERVGPPMLWSPFRSVADAHSS